MPDIFQQTTSRGYGSRLGNSIMGAVVGIAMFFGSFGLLWWNEGNFVTVAKGLAEGRSAVVELDGGKISSDNDGKLVHITDKTSTGKDLLADSTFGIKSDALMLERKVEMYQWKEKKETDSHESVGGTETTTTTYTYTKEWSTELNSSAEFGKPEGHENPSTIPYESDKQFAEDAKLGEFNLRDSTVDKIGDGKSVPVAGFDVKTIPNSHINGSYVYIGKQPTTPAIGDVRVSFSAILPGTISVVAKQDGDSLVPYKASSGSTIELVANGERSSEELFTEAETANKTMTWIYRAVGFLLMWIGLTLVFKPLSMVFAFLPFLRGLVGFVVGAAMFAVALVLSGITIALAWLFYRPLVSIIILVVAVGIAWLVKALILDKKKPNSDQQPPQNPQPPTAQPPMQPPQPPIQPMVQPTPPPTPPPVQQPPLPPQPAQAPPPTPPTSGPMPPQS